MGGLSTATQYKAAPGLLQTVARLASLPLGAPASAGTHKRPRPASLRSQQFRQCAAFYGQEAGTHVFGAKAGVVGVHAVLSSTIIGGYAIVPVAERHS